MSVIVTVQLSEVFIMVNMFQGSVSVTGCFFTFYFHSFCTLLKWKCECCVLIEPLTVWFTVYLV